ncbi:MAG: sugar-binding transcriptional regulator [Actinobacteria bacterium]|nr:sugar-binding transcriptional regulator [Actinomycetota bacterium]
MNKSEELKLLSKISRLYYLEDLNQQIIADKLNISRTKVSRYLSKARKEGIVEIKVYSTREKFEELERSIEKKFGIKECLIVTTSEEIQETYRQMAVSLTNLLERFLNDGDMLGVGWGTTLKSVAEYIEPDKEIALKVVPLLGGLGKTGIEFHTNSVAKVLAEKFKGISYVLHSPGVLDSKQTREILEKDSSVSEIIEMFGKLKTAVIGLSDLGKDSTMIKTGNFTIQDFEYLSKLGAVGDANLIFIDKHGLPVPNRLDERIVKIPFEKLKRISNVIGIAFGEKKLNVILGALTNCIVNIMITDEMTGLKLLES